MFDICMLVHNEVTNDGRVVKEAQCLADAGWRVLVIGIVLNDVDVDSVEEVAGFTVWRVKPQLLMKTMPATWGKLIRLAYSVPVAIMQLRKAKAKVYHGHDFPALLFFAFAGIFGRKVVYDSHELFFDRWPEDSTYPILRFRRLLRWIEKILARQAIACISVSPSIVNILSDKFSNKYSILLRNVVDLAESEVSDVDFEANEHRVVVHTGSLVRGRNLLNLVRAIKYMPNDIWVVLLGKGEMEGEILELAKELQVSDRIKIIPPVRFTQVSETIKQADIAIVIITNDCLSYEYSLPNKLYEAIAAGLPIVISNNKDMVNLVKEYNIGEICNPSDPRSIAASIEQVLQPEHYQRFQLNSQKAQKELTWDQEKKKLVELYNKILI